MKQVEVMVVLVILVLFNIALTCYLLKQIRIFNQEWNLLKYRIEDNTIAEANHYDGTMHSLHYISECIKQIPHEITVRNVLKLP